jgi:serine/threonine protein kinase
MMTIWLCRFRDGERNAYQAESTLQVLHSDLKTKNILLTSSGTAKLGDVGLSEFLEHNFNSPDKIACALAGRSNPSCGV